MEENKEKLNQEAKRFLIPSTEKKAEDLSKLLDEFFVKKENSEEENNRMFALYGGWGTGKTTLLEETKKFLENNSKKLKTKNKYKIVWFKPWEYDNEGKDLDLKLLTLIQDKISLPFFKKISSYFSYLMNLIKNYLGIWLVLSTLLFFSIIFSEKIEKINTQIDNFWVWVNNYDLLYIVISVLFLVLISLPVAWYLMKSFKKIGVNFNMGPFNLNMNSQDFIQNIKYGIKKSDTIKNKFKKILGTNKVIVFVDDLDRCQGETVLNLMEHIKHFYSVENILFVFAIDQEKLAQYVVNKYGYKSNDNSLKEGYAYLDKFFAKSYRLQYMSEIRDFMRKIYQEEGILEEIQNLEFKQKINLQEMFYQLVEFYCSFNLRKVENLVREFAKAFRKTEFQYNTVDKDYHKFSIDQIFRVLIIKEFYPELFNRKDWRSASFDNQDLKYVSLQINKVEYHLLGEYPLPEQEGFYFNKFLVREVVFWHIVNFIDTIDREYFSGNFPLDLE